MLPYLVVLIGALAGVNVFIVLIAGTVLSLIAGVGTGAFGLGDMFTHVGEGIMGMYDITVISIIVASIVALVKEYGGIDFILSFIRKRISGERKRASRGWHSWWTCVPPTIRWPLLCPDPLQRKSAMTLA